MLSCMSDSRLPGQPDSSGQPDSAAAADLIETLLGDEYGITSALEAEVGVAMLLGFGRVLGFGEAEWQIDLLARLEAAATPTAVGLIVAYAVLSDGAASEAAMLAFDRAGAHVIPPAWAEELPQRPTAGRLVSLDDREGDVWALAAEFSRGAETDGFLLVVEPDECGAAAEVVVTDSDEMPGLLAMVSASATEQGFPLKAVTLDPAEFRWRAEAALDARDVHDQGEALEPEDYMDEDGPGYRALAPVLRSRLRWIPEPARPRPPHGAHRTADEVGGGDALVALLAQGWDLGGTGNGSGLGSVQGLSLGNGFGPARRVRRPLPEKPKRPPRTAPIYQIRVDLKGMKPPIWRRLEVPMNITLFKLHGVLQAAFGWQDYHLHVFETDYGPFGEPDPDLDYRSDKSATLEQVAGPGDKITYTYDFGDSWDHTITVEQEAEREPKVFYPRCTGGRRAGPPEDSGGIWGYQELLRILADPAHEEHESRLDWLGLRDASEFDPAAFDMTAINADLGPRSRRSR
jgi:hypothetical protein